MIRKVRSDAKPFRNPDSKSVRALLPDLYLPQTDDRNFYGRFITLGYHSTSGPLDDPLQQCSGRNKQFLLCKRITPTGLKFMPVLSKRPRGSRRLPIPRPRRRKLNPINRRLQVKWTVADSPDHDLFQFGRDPSNNDFYIPGHTTQRGEDRFASLEIFIYSCSFVSRQSFQVACNRNTNEVRIAASGYDYADSLFLGPAALTWRTKVPCSLDGLEQVDRPDGGITAGLHVWKPNSIRGGGNWYEISVLGEVYHLRVNGKRGGKAKGVDNLLTDGCIVVNAESVLLFSTIPPSQDQRFLTPTVLQRYLEQEKTIFCPITFDPIPFNNSMVSGRLYPGILIPVPTLASARNDIDLYANRSGRPGVFPKCGHIFELPPSHIKLESCPKCRTKGCISPLTILTLPTFFPMEGQFILEKEFTHVLPCGHAVSEELGRRMTAVALPTVDLLMKETVAQDWVDCFGGDKRRCWFCGRGFNPEDLTKLYYDHDEC